MNCRGKGQPHVHAAGIFFDRPLNEFADIGESLAAAQRARRNARPEGEDRRVLARMVRAAPGRIIAVIAGLTLGYAIFGM